MTRLTLVRLLGCLLSLTHVSVSPAQQQGAAVADPVRAEFASLFEAMAANSQAVKTGDVFCKIRVLFDSVDGMSNHSGILKSQELTFRHRFDRERKKYLYVESGEHYLLDLVTDDELPEPVKRAGPLWGFILDGETGYFCPQRDKVLRMDNIDPVRIIRSRVPDFQHIGITPFPSSLSNTQFEALLARLVHSPAPIRVVRASNGSVAFREELRKPTAPDFSLNVTTEFDTSRLTIRSRVVEGVESGPEGGAGLISEERFEWREINGVSLPASIIQSAPQQVRHAGRTEQAVEEIHVDFVWISVNEELDDEQFDLRLIRRVEEMGALVDETRIKPREN